MLPSSSSQKSSCYTFRLCALHPAVLLLLYSSSLTEHNIMTSLHIQTIAQELSLTEKQVMACATLLDEGATVPFVSRYRKEATGSLDEVAVIAVRNRLAQLRELDKRREAILISLEDMGKLTGELKTVVLDAKTLMELEDIYLPYRPKRRTKA